MKVIVGMSGGVDSSVAAYLLKEQGYEVEGVSFIIEERRLGTGNSESSCCSVESILDARKTARRLGIGHTMVNLRNEFVESVIEPFAEAYEKGLTPNPCILCNEHIKFRFLLKIADERKADFIATGHYARVVTNAGHFNCGMQNAECRTQIAESEGEGKLLLKGIDPRKDQSYVLYVLKQEELRRLILPLGERKKDEVREIARRLDLPSAKRLESQEICFVGDRNYLGFLEGLTENRSGPLIEFETGRVLGVHRGIHAYTIGQRKRLGVATGSPLYVAKIDRSANAVYVGQRESAMGKEFEVKDVNWQVPIRRFTDSPVHRFTVKVRSTMKDEPATVAVLDEKTVRVKYDEPQWAPAPGQSAVFYQGEAVIGGGVIAGNAPIFRRTEEHSEVRGK